jgi:hypothetical protein
MVCVRRASTRACVSTSGFRARNTVHDHQFARAREQAHLRDHSELSNVAKSEGIQAADNQRKVGDRRARLLRRGTFVLAAGFGAEAQFVHSSPSFGHGVKGYGRYAAASYADWTIGNVMTEGLYPTLLHQDPRYFRRGEGSGWSRLRYAVGQILWTHTDSGRAQFNFSEIVGNSTAVALSNLYYPDNRTVANGASKLAVQIGVDMAANILKEFSPDWVHARSRKDRPKAN